MGEGLSQDVADTAGVERRSRNPTYIAEMYLLRRYKFGTELDSVMSEQEQQHVRKLLLIRSGVCMY